MDICEFVLSVFGIVNVGDELAICEPLSLSYLLFFKIIKKNVERTSKTIKIFEMGLEELHRCYSGTRKMALHQTSFPYKNIANIDGTITTLQYDSVITPHVFVVKKKQRAAGYREKCDLILQRSSRVLCTQRICTEVACM